MQGQTALWKQLHANFSYDFFIKLFNGRLIIYIYNISIIDNIFICCRPDDVFDYKYDIYRRQDDVLTIQRRDGLSEGYNKRNILQLDEKSFAKEMKTLPHRVALYIFIIYP